MDQVTPSLQKCQRFWTQQDLCGQVTTSSSWGRTNVSDMSPGFPSLFFVMHHQRLKSGWGPGLLSQERPYSLGEKKRKTSTTTVGIICHFFRWTHHHYIFHDFLVTGLKWSEICSSVFNTLLPHGPYSPWNSPGQNTGVGSLSLLKGNPGLLHCGQILYQLSYQGRSWDNILFISVFMTPGAEQVLRRFSAIISHSLNTSVWKSPTISTTFQLYCQGCSAFSHYVKKPLL